jgi:hypothetical protein
MPTGLKKPEIRVTVNCITWGSGGEVTVYADISENAFLVKAGTMSGRIGSRYRLKCAEPFVPPREGHVYKMIAY